jgi:thiol-disulfide isomerase/thioredoxin
MRLLLSIFLLAMYTSMQAQPAYNKFKDENTAELIYKGHVTFEDLQKESEFTWIKNADNYVPNEDATNDLKNFIKQYDLVVLMGTWCEDSHNLIPKLYKVLQAADYPLQQLTMYGLDRNKKGKANEEGTYKVTNVPTIIVFKGDKEVGRITESVQLSIEADLLKIVDQSLTK